MKGRVRERCFGGRGLLPDIWGDESGSSRKRGWRRCFSPLLLCFFRHMVGKFSISPICPCHGFLAAFWQFWYSRIKSLDILLQIRTWRYRNADKKIPFMVQFDITLEASILPFQTSFVKPKTDRQINVIPPLCCTDHCHLAVLALKCFSDVGATETTRLYLLNVFEFGDSSP